MKINEPSKIKIIPSIASANPLELGREIERLAEYPFLHIDMEDTSFVPNATFGMKTVRAIAKKTSAQLDAHLMLARPDEWIQPLAEAGVRQLCVQIEALPFPQCTLERIRNAGMEAGLAFTMKTSIEQLQSYKDEVSYVLLLATEPSSRECFNPYVLEKLRQARAILPAEKSLWVDGGLDAQSASAAVQSGADTLIIGRMIWGSQNPVAAIEDIFKSL